VATLLGSQCPVGLTYFLLVCVVCLYLLVEYFCAKFGMNVLFVMYELLDILIACMVGGFL
jgi:hypothetical protein